MTGKEFGLYAIIGIAILIAGVAINGPDGDMNALAAFSMAAPIVVPVMGAILMRRKVRYRRRS